MSELTVSIRSGRTSYYLGRNPDGKDAYIVKGRASNESIYVWRVRQDPTTRRYFFVNDGGLGKKWRLPDYREATFQEELRSVMPADFDREDNIYVQERSGGGTGGELPQSHNSSAAMSDIHQNDTFLESAHQPTVGGGSAYDDAEWAAAEISYNRTAKLQAAEDKRSIELEEEREVLRRAREAAETRRQQQQQAAASTQVLPPTSTTRFAIDEDGPYRRTDSAPSSRSRPSHLPIVPSSPLHDEDMSRVERDHASQVLKDAERLLLASEQGLSRGSASHHNASSQPLVSSLSPSSVGDSSSPHYVAHQVASLTHVIDGLQRMLEQERHTNARLTKELQERDRVIMERNLADAEAEEDDTRFKMRMLEALSAKKRESERDKTLVDEQRARNEYAQQQDLLARRR